MLTPEQVAELRRQRYNATVVWLRKVHPELMRLRVRGDFPKPAHVPGQYSTLGLGYWEPRHPGCQEEILKPGDETKLVRRAYSISCPILDDNGQLLRYDEVDWLEYYIVLVASSDKAQAPGLTPRLFMLREGDRIYMGEKITGHYTLAPVQPHDTVLLLSTGTGEAPHNYMLWELLRRQHPGRILAACCVRYRRDLAYLSVHEELMRRYPNYTFVPLTTREADTVQHKVYIQDLILSGQLEEKLGQPLDPARTHVFLCGNPKMIGVPVKDRETGARSYPQPTGVVEILEKRGFQADQPQAKVQGNIHFEEYW
ncbi:MAG: ferredoxin--NADP reductase [Gemmataceae bacterium]|nr:ferredoxin--NADP reductase [Gemmataceae bacterium]MDW8263916.1 ferredoxin--NADP reductase [Gemmataceae bacterium]